jgi:hypothetical protein
MARRPTLDEIFDEPDEFRLLEVTVKARRTRTPEDERNAGIVREVNDFFEREGRVPNPEAADHEEMRLGVIWRRLKARRTDALTEEDRNGLFDQDEAPKPGRDWRDEPDADEIPASLDDIFADADIPISDAVATIKNVTPAAQRTMPDHRAEMRPCPDFEAFIARFDDMQKHLETGEREVSVIVPNQVIEPLEGDFFIRKGLLAYIAEKAEMSLRGGKRDHRLRVIFSNGTESDLLVSSFRKSLAEDATSRLIHRPGLGPLDPDWQADRLDLTGTIYVARSRSEEPAVKEVRTILHKIGVTTQDVTRRVADARNDPTFLLAPVDIVATYELRNLSRHKIEDLLHRFFEAARPADLYITDRFGKKVRPREWFYVLPEHVAQAVAAIRDGTLHQFEYDPATQTIRVRPN